jgi:DNA-binding phage protein
MTPYIDYQAYLVESLKYTEKAQAYLEVALEEYEQQGDAPFCLLAVRNVMEAQGGIIPLAERTQIPAEQLEQVLSSEEAPPLRIIGLLLHGLGFRLRVARATAA